MGCLESFESASILIENGADISPRIDYTIVIIPMKRFARVAELVDALDLGSSAARRGGSSPPFRTSFFDYL